MAKRATCFDLGLVIDMLTTIIKVPVGKDNIQILV
jgi:hypothetical protein